jgi:hypothetical protein
VRLPGPTRPGGAIPPAYSPGLVHISWHDTRSGRVFSGKTTLDIVVHLADGKLLRGVPVSDVKPLSRVTVFVDALHDQRLGRWQHRDFADLKAHNFVEITIQLGAGVGHSEFISRKLPQVSFEFVAVAAVH